MDNNEIIWNMNEYCMNMIHDMVGNWFFRCYELYHSDEWFRNLRTRQLQRHLQPSGLHSSHYMRWLGRCGFWIFWTFPPLPPLCGVGTVPCWGTISRSFWSCIGQCGHQNSAEPINLFFKKKTVGFCQGLVVISWLFKHVFWRALLHQWIRKTCLSFSHVIKRNTSNNQTFILSFHKKSQIISHLFAQHSWKPMPVLYIILNRLHKSIDHRVWKTKPNKKNTPKTC